MYVLLAIDLGMKAGMAWFSGTGKLIRCRSAHFPNRTTLKKALPGVFRECPGVTHVVLEGMGTIAQIWLDYARKQQLPCLQVSAETWRQDMLLQREQKNGASAKLNAEKLAAKILQQNNIHKTTPLGDDEAEAILCGQWAVNKLRNGTF